VRRSSSNRRTVTSGSRRETQRGQILVLFTLALVAMIAMVGLVIDGGAAYAQRRAQQNAADVAALAGADALYNGQTNAQAIAVAEGVAGTNSYGNGINGVTVNVAIADGVVTVDVGAPHRNYFAGVVGQPNWQISTTASAIAGIPDTARGAAPVIMPIEDFNADGSPKTEYMEAACAPLGCLWDNCQPCDAPDNATSWAWTVYGDPPNANTSDVAAYLEAFGTCGGTAVADVSVQTGEHPDWGQSNQGNHNGAITQGGDCIEGLDVPVPIVGPPVAPATTCDGSSDTDGCFMGWAIFHVVSIEKDGNESDWRGWFLPLDVQYPNLLINTACTMTTCPEIGDPDLHLIN
jgi:Flp pilus assembly protein TadG